jgi:BlaI family penicillinase repressor
MVRPKNENLTPLELEIMNVLWDLGSANVQAVQQKLERNSAYTTVQTMLNILERKGKVKRELKDRAYIYRPAISRKKVISQIFGDMIDKVFGGSAESLVMSLVETKHLTPEKLAQLNSILKETTEGEDDRD